MCLIALGFDVSSEHVLVLAANRDERHARASTPANWWPERPQILAGRDLVAGGTWLGIDRIGRIAALTNVHEPQRIPAPRSRGELVVQFLRGIAPAEAFSDDLGPVLDRYAAFNLLLYDGSRLKYASNRSGARDLGNGIHVLSNADPNAEWPKVRRARAGLAEWLNEEGEADALLDLLAERAPRREAPEYYRESLFVEGGEYGTRCSTVLTIARTGAVMFIERRFDADGRAAGECRYEFELEVGTRRALTAGDP
jgi:uncharacterized protein with NRDE domain